jgi:hypothetical protein
VQDALAMKLLAGDLHEGETVEIDRGQDALEFRVVEAAQLG